MTPNEILSLTQRQPQFGVHFPDVVTADATSTPAREEHAQAAKVVENSFTPDIEDLLSNLTSPLEVVHQVAPAEVRQHADKWKGAAQDELDSLIGMGAIKRHKGADARKILQDKAIEVLPAKCVFTVKPGRPFRRKVRIVSLLKFGVRYMFNHKVLCSYTAVTFNTPPSKLGNDFP